MKSSQIRNCNFLKSLITALTRAQTFEVGWNPVSRHWGPEMMHSDVSSKYLQLSLMFFFFPQNTKQHGNLVKMILSFRFNVYRHLIKRKYVYTAGHHKRTYTSCTKYFMSTLQRARFQIFECITEKFIPKSSFFI